MSDQDNLLDSDRIPEENPPSSMIGAGPADVFALYRILDASANRCREGLRVVEDYVRFHLDDALISVELKEIRHLLTATLNRLGQQQWTAARDTLQDVGTLGSLDSEHQRGSLVDVLRANLKRVEEALRTLDEYSKLIDSVESRRISGCRYRMYTVEKALETTLRSRTRLQDCRLYLLVTAASCLNGAEKTIRDSLEGGVDLVQLREKSMPDRELLVYAQQVREWTSAAGKLLIINDRPDIALAVGADGVHLGQDDLDVTSARRILGVSSLIGVSTHTLEQARKAVFDGADYLGVGPVFPSATKEFTQLSGLEFVKEVAKSISLPWFAIGGINDDNLTQGQAAGASRIAVSHVVCSSADPRIVSKGLADRLWEMAAPQRV